MPWYAPAFGQWPHWANPGSALEKSFLSMGWVETDGTIPTPGVPVDPAAARLVKAINGKLADITGGITLTPADIGALDQTAGDARYPRKSDLVLNVKDYGAKGDNTANDTNPIGSARGAAGIGGTIYFPPGTYLTDGLNASVADQTWILHPQATIKLKPAASSLYALRLNTPGVTVRGGTLDGNRANITGGNPFQIRETTDIVVEGTTIRNTKTYGLSVNGSQRVSIRRCKFFDCEGGVGSITHSAATGPSTDVEFCDNFVDQRGMAAFPNVGGFSSNGNTAAPNRRLRFSGNRILVARPTAPSSAGCIGVLGAEDVTVAANVMEGGAITVSIAAASKRVTVTGNTIRGFYDYGLEFAGTSDCTGTGNVIDGAGAANECVSVNGTAARTVLSGNTVDSSNTKSGIYLAAGVVDTTITGNVVRRSAAGSGCVTLNGTARVAITGNTFVGSAAEATGVKLIGSLGEVAITGNQFRDFTAAAVTIDAAAATTTNHVAIVGNTAVNVTAMHAVTGAATLGPQASITANAA